MTEKKVDLLKLIEFEEEHHIIWDVRYDDYKMAERKPLIWRDIEVGIKLRI
jgi:hypothetical protein